MSYPSRFAGQNGKRSMTSIRTVNIDLQLEHFEEFCWHMFRRPFLYSINEWFSALRREPTLRSASVSASISWARHECDVADADADLWTT